jgi:hypothetical protein
VSHVLIQTNPIYALPFSCFKLYTVERVFILQRLVYKKVKII